METRGAVTRARRAEGRTGTQAAVERRGPVAEDVVSSSWKLTGFLGGTDSAVARLKRWLIGGARDLSDRSLFHKVALIPVLAWVGMGADGLSSSAYGPEESFKVLGAHLYIAPMVILAAMLTIVIISIAYSRVIEHFPHGGGGYVVASHLLGPTAGVISGCALTVDYVLTITVSVAAGGDALFSNLPPDWARSKMAAELFAMVVLLVVNLRGVKESVLSVAPVFFAFVASHIALIIGAFVLHASQVPQVEAAVTTGWGDGLKTLGWFGILALFFKSYSMGAGTYTGIEAVSNGLGILREPQVASGKRTMLYMAASLAFAAGGLFAGYLLVGVHPVEGQTLNAVLAHAVFTGGPFGTGAWSTALISITLLSEAGLLVIAAQTGFIDGPRVMANMAMDSWFPKRFAALSERLTMQNGVLLFGISSIAALLYTHGNTDTLVLMYSINVFITFSLTETSMVNFYWGQRKTNPGWLGKIYIHVIGLILCSSILVVMVVEKFAAGGWLTTAITTALVGLCFWIRGYYRRVQDKVHRLDDLLIRTLSAKPAVHRAPDPAKPTAVILVSGFSSLGIHSLVSVFKVFFPGHFRNVVFVSVGAVDSGSFKGAEALAHLREQVKHDLERYVDLASRLGIAAAYEMEVTTDVVGAASGLCLKAARRFSKTVVFGSKLIFQRERWYQRWMHNQTVYAIQNRLQWAGVPMTVLPVRVLDSRGGGRT